MDDRRAADIRRRRAELGLTQAAAAKKAKVSRSTWSDLEAGKPRSYRLSTLNSVERALQIDAGLLNTDRQSSAMPATSTVLASPQASDFLAAHDQIAELTDKVLTLWIDSRNGPIVRKMKFGYASSYIAGIEAMGESMSRMWAIAVRRGMTDDEYLNEVILPTLFAMPPRSIVRILEGILAFDIDDPRWASTDAWTEEVIGMLGPQYLKNRSLDSQGLPKTS